MLCAWSEEEIGWTNCGLSGDNGGGGCRHEDVRGMRDAEGGRREERGGMRE